MMRIKKMSEGIWISIIGAIVAIVGAPFATYLVQRARGATELTINERQVLLKREEALRQEIQNREEAVRQERTALDLERKTEIQNLKLTNRTMGEALAAVEDRCDKLEQETRRLSAKVEEQERVIEQQAEHIIDRDQEITRLRQRVKTLEDENLRLYRQVDELRKSGTP